MDFKMINLLAVILACTYVSAQVFPAVPVPQGETIPEDKISSLSVTTDSQECITSLIREREPLAVEQVGYTEDEEAAILGVEDSVHQKDPDDAETFAGLIDSVAKTATAETRSLNVPIYHVGYFWRNPCNPVRKFAQLDRAQTTNGQWVTVHYPRRIYQVQCGSTNFCRCYGRCVQEFSWQRAYVSYNSCRYFWALIRVPCGCSCHTYFPYYWHY